MRVCWSPEPALKLSLCFYFHPLQVGGHPATRQLKDWRNNQRLMMYNDVTVPLLRRGHVPILDQFGILKPMIWASELSDSNHFDNLFPTHALVNAIFNALLDDRPKTTDPMDARTDVSAPWLPAP